MITMAWGSGFPVRPGPIRVCNEIRVTTCLGLLPPSFVVHSSQIHADMLLTHVSLEGKIPAAYGNTYFITDPKLIQEWPAEVWQRYQDLK